MALILDGTNGLSDVDGSAATPAIRGSDTNTGIFFPAADTIAFAEGGVESMRLDSAGNVGIGTSSPANIGAGLTHLEVNGSTTGVFSVSANGVRGLSLSADGANANIQARVSGQSLTFSTNNAGTVAERARIDSSGNLLVGTTSVFTAGRVSAIGSINAFVGRVPNNNFSNFVGENTSGSATFFVQGSGQINSTSTSIAAISDQSLKENVRDLETGLVEVMALRPRRFDWKEGEGTGEKDVAGFIAQELEAVLPDLVYEFPRGDEETKKAIKMGDILPTLVKAIQEQQAIIEQLKADVAALKGAQV
jgi:hypothetical protein